MFTEYEIETMVEIPEILEAAAELKRDFLKTEAPYLEINDHDFFSLVMMAPTVGIALADGHISLFEEIALNKKARKLSKGGYFMKKDPVVYAMKFLIKNYYNWSDKYFSVLKIAINKACDMSNVAIRKIDTTGEVDYKEYKKEVLNSPYILIRFIASFFLENDEDIINSNHKIGKEEYQRMMLIGEKLGLDQMVVFQMFCQTFK
ncbi:MAG: hypothetical protein RIM99_09700 [Cyclobacteriaceae bacterium]